MKILICTMPLALLVTGCAGLSDKQISRFDAMSCSQLAVALDYEQRGQTEAEESGFYNALTSLGSRGEGRFNADVAMSDDDFDADNHREARKYINERQDRLGC
ncbi:MAG: hypothetical protein AAF291_11880 [Pseudomonadota bacterium]